MNTWRVRKLAPWELIYDPTLRPWVIERALWGRWVIVGRNGTHAGAIRRADRRARR